MLTISASAARQTLPAQLDRVEAGGEVSITRHGRVVAVLVSPDRLRSRRAEESWSVADALHARLVHSQGQSLTATLDGDRADDLVRRIRTDRSDR